MSLYSDLNRKDARTRPRVFDMEAVLHAIENILSQPPRQRLFRPEGVDLDGLLFELDGNDENIDVEWRVKNMVFEALKTDPRVQMLYNQSYVVADPENNTFKVVVRFSIKGFEQNRIQTKVGTIRAAGS